jgi:hypothetical protein
MRRGIDAISLWHCWGVMEEKDSSLLGLMSLIFLLARSGEFAGQSSTEIQWSLNQVLLLLAVWADA